MAKNILKMFYKKIIILFIVAEKKTNCDFFFSALNRFERRINYRQQLEFQS